MATRSAEMRAQGIDVINFSVGEPDFNTPVHIRKAAKEAMDDGFTKYTAGPGMIEFREAICKKLKQENDIEYVCRKIISFSKTYEWLGDGISEFIQNESIFDISR